MSAGLEPGTRPRSTRSQEDLQQSIRSAGRPRNCDGSVYHHYRERLEAENLVQGAGEPDSAGDQVPEVGEEEERVCVQKVMQVKLQCCREDGAV